MGTELVQYQADPQALSLYMPVVDVRMAIERRNMIEAFTKNVMVPERDFGAIPGTGSKPTLLKAGAEKLCSFFGLLPDFVTVERILDFDGSGDGHGEALIYYRIRCDLYKNGVKVGSGEASCHSRETKYRWRNAGRVCPNCGKATIRKGSDQYGGGWYCDAKKADGCGAQWKPKGASEATLKAIAAIEAQVGGQIPNPDVADLDNTILKMASKRALVAATLIATNVSDFFTQDMEDFASVGSTLEYDVEVKAQPVKTNGKPAPEPEPERPSTQQLADLRERFVDKYGDGAKEGYKAATKELFGGVLAMDKLTLEQYESLFYHAGFIQPEAEPS